MKSTFFKMFAATILFAAVHSAFASRRAKDTAARRFGARSRNAFYRPFFILQSLLTLGILGLAARNWKDRTLYQARGPLAWSMRLGQVAGLALATWTAGTVGFTRISGWNGLVRWLRGDRLVPPAPEAQGPALGPGGYRMRSSGPFRASRHPLNFAPLPILWLFPRMTVRLLAFNLAATVYLVLGSVHEEARLLHAYGKPYAYYRQSGVPFYIPFLV